MPDKTIERIVRFMDILISIPENKREAVAASMEMLATGAAIAVNTEEVKT